MTQQPEPLRLADRLGKATTQPSDEIAAAAELRRLHEHTIGLKAVAEDLIEQHAKDTNRITELEDALRQALEALERVAEAMPFPVGRGAIIAAEQALEGEAAIKQDLTPQPRQWRGLTDEDREDIFNSLPDALEGFLKKWGWLHFSKAVEAKLKEKNHA